MTSPPSTPQQSSISILSQPLSLPCGITLPNRLVKCPMQETCASPPNFDPPLSAFRNLYNTWSTAQYGLIITGQVQIDLRYFSIAGDVCCHRDSIKEPVFSLWKEWASIAQKEGTPCIVQLAHPGRMSPKGAGNRPADMPALCPSSVPVKIGFGEGWLDKLALETLLGTPKEMTLEEIDEVVEMFLNGARVAKEAGFKGVQIHGAHGFLVSEFLSPHTNRRTDSYGGTPDARMKFLRRLVTETRSIIGPNLILSVKLNSGDYMETGMGLTQDEAFTQVRWLTECGLVDFVEISGGNAEQKTSKLHNSFNDRSLQVVPKRKESTRIREAAFIEFAERVEASHPSIPIQLSGGFRSRNGMADAIESNACQLIGLGRTAVLQPSIPKEILLNDTIADDEALAQSHQIRGIWFSNLIPAKIVGSGLSIQFFYWNMRRLGRGLMSMPDASIPWVVLTNTWEMVGEMVGGLGSKVRGMVPSLKKGGRVDIKAE